MHNIVTSPSPERGADLSRLVARLREQDMAGFRITDDDFDFMEEIARVSSHRAGATRWTELAVYHRPGENRPFVAVSEGVSIVPGEKLRRQHAAMGTLDRAMNWFEGSELRDQLADAVDRWVEQHKARQDRTLDRLQLGLAKIKAARDKDVLPMLPPGPGAGIGDPGPGRRLQMSGSSRGHAHSLPVQSRLIASWQLQVKGRSLLRSRHPVHMETMVAGTQQPQNMLCI